MKKMIVKSTTFGLVLALTVSCAKNDSKNDGNGPKAGEQQKSNSILGVWELLPIQDQGITLVMRIKFESKKATQTVVCTYPDGAKVEAQTSSPAVIDEQAKTIENLESSEKVEKAADGKKDCRAAIAKGKMTYKITDNQLIFADADGSNPQVVSKKKISD